MPYRAWVYILGVIGAGAALIAFALATPPPNQWGTFLVLVVLATLAEHFRSEGPNNQFHSATSLFQFVGLLLLAPFFFVLLVAIPLLIDWTRARLTNSPRLREWYKQPFNIAMFTLAGFAALATGRLLAGGPLDPSVVSPRMMAAITVAAVVHLLTNQLLLGGALSLAARIPLRESRVLEPGFLLIHLIFLLMGYTTAILWTLHPVLILLTLAPLVLLYRVLAIPQLQADAQTDSKTGLLNARHFNVLVAEEYEKARQRNRRFAILMADLDLLRDINNRYGHLAGDAVLMRVGEILRATIRGADIAGRFGGEEFAVLLPDGTVKEARQVADRIRDAVAREEFEVAAGTRVQVTMSVGVAIFPDAGDTLQEVLHAADTALYEAKQLGRNRVVCYNQHVLSQL